METKKSSCFVTIGTIEFTCDYDYVREPLGIWNLTVEFAGEDFTGLLTEGALETIEHRIFMEEAEDR